MANSLTLIAPACVCCAEPSPLLPRDDLPGGLAVCGETGQLYRPAGSGYVPTDLPALPATPQPESVRIDLSQAGYA
ncbi:MAG TPA: hypothetical protein VD886_20680 [Herpetosiphonaceae bacterium]|nr:hypothetical protein [Herpetosiphonaceae bacterium]